MENEYTFYSDGSIIHEYDKDEIITNVVDQISVADLSSDVRIKILNACSSQYQEKLRNLFNQY